MVLLAKNCVTLAHLILAVSWVPYCYLPSLQMKQLRHREVKWLTQDSQLISDRASAKVKAVWFGSPALNHCAITQFNFCWINEWMNIEGQKLETHSLSFESICGYEESSLSRTMPYAIFFFPAKGFMWRGLLFPKREGSTRGSQEVIRARNQWQCLWGGDILTWFSNFLFPNTTSHKRVAEKYMIFH